jgi:hypothetical protein
LHSIFNSYVKTGPKFIHRKLNKLTQLEHTDISFSTLKYALFNWVVEDFYIKSENKKKIKIVSKNSINRLTPVSLSYWLSLAVSVGERGTMVHLINPKII